MRYSRETSDAALKADEWNSVHRHPLDGAIAGGGAGGGDAGGRAIGAGICRRTTGERPRADAARFRARRVAAAVRIAAAARVVTGAHVRACRPMAGTSPGARQSHCATVIPPRAATGTTRRSPARPARGCRVLCRGISQTRPRDPALLRTAARLQLRTARRRPLAHPPHQQQRGPARARRHEHRRGLIPAVRVAKTIGTTRRASAGHARRGRFLPRHGKQDSTQMHANGRKKRKWAGDRHAPKEARRQADRGDPLRCVPSPIRVFCVHLR